MNFLYIPFILFLLSFSLCAAQEGVPAAVAEEAVPHIVAPLVEGAYYQPGVFIDQTNEDAIAKNELVESEDVTTVKLPVMPLDPEAKRIERELAKEAKAQYELEKEKEEERKLKERKRKEALRKAELAKQERERLRANAEERRRLVRMREERKRLMIKLKTSQKGRSH